jgi:FkbM family methyltransferase
MKLSDHEPWLIPYIPKSGKTAIDIGSAQGLWTEVLASRFRTVVALDPVQQLPPLPYSNITFIKKAAWSYPAHITFNSFNNMDQSSAVFGRGEYRNYDVQIATTDADAITIDSLKLKNVDFIKIDVEGAELEVLKGSRKTIKKNSPHILIEVHNPQYVAEIHKALLFYEMTVIPRPDGETYNLWLYCAPISMYIDKLYTRLSEFMA